MCIRAPAQLQVNRQAGGRPHVEQMQWCVSDLKGMWDKTGAGLSRSQWHKAIQHVSKRQKSSPGDESEDSPGADSIYLSLCQSTERRGGMGEGKRETMLWEKDGQKDNTLPEGEYLESCQLYFVSKTFHLKRSQVKKALTDQGLDDSGLCAGGTDGESRGGLRHRPMWPGPGVPANQGLPGKHSEGRLTACQ